MIISPKNVAIANELRQRIQDLTDTVSDGEGVAMTILWSFFMEHARIHSLDVEELARDQLDSFITYAHKNMQLVRQH